MRCLPTAGALRRILGAVVATLVAITALVLPAGAAAPGFAMQIDARGLTNTSFQLLRTTPDPHAFGILDGTVVQTLDLTPGVYRFQPGSGLVMSCALTVTSAGTWDYDSSCDGFLAGVGTALLRVLGHPVHLDARPLSNDAVLLAHLFDLPMVSTDSVQPLQLVPAAGYNVQVGSGLLCDCSWTVGLDGTVDYASVFDAFMGGRGTDTVELRGHPVAIDARALSTRHFVLPNVLGLAGPATMDSTVVQPLQLLPVGGGYLFQYLSIATFRWNVDRQGGVTYDARFDPYLAGRGTSVLQIVGYPVEVDATALDATARGAGQFQIFRLTVGAFDPDVVQRLTLVPARFEFYTGPVRFVWHVAEDGTVDYDPALEPCVTGKGTPRLTVRCDPAAGPREVAVDVKPGSERNPVNLRSGAIPVAVLTTAGFDATTLDPSTVCFGDAEAPAERDCTEAHGSSHQEDVDGDGDLDLLLHYETAETGIDPGDTSACLHGETPSREPVRGCDTITVVPVPA